MREFNKKLDQKHNVNQDYITALSAGVTELEIASHHKLYYYSFLIFIRRNVFLEYCKCQVK